MRSDHGSSHTITPSIIFKPDALHFVDHLRNLYGRRIVCGHYVKPLRNGCMGTSTDAHCFACGYDTLLRLGGGMSNFKTYSAWPVTCEKCAAITTANFKQSPLACERCESNDVKPMTEPYESWGNLALLTEGHYRCPKCHQRELRFGTNVRNHPKIRWD